MSRRRNGKGTITQRKDGRWMAQIMKGKNSNGSWIRPTLYGKTYQEVEDKLNQYLDIHPYKKSHEPLDVNFFDLVISEGLSVTQRKNNTWMARKKIGNKYDGEIHDLCFYGT